MLKRSVQIGFLVIGFISLILGIIGIFLPLLPTTPFLLLTAYCFNRGSKRFHSWLLEHPFLGRPIQDWERNKSIRPLYKVMATSMIFVSSYFIFLKPTIPFVGKVSYGVFVSFVLSFILSRKNR